MKLNDLTGKKINNWHVVERSFTNNRHIYWKCWCDCQKDIPDNEKDYYDIIGCNLNSGKSKSCGCLKQEAISKAKKKYNTYDLSGKYGIGYTLKGEPFYFDLEDYDKIKNYCWEYDKDQYCVSNDYNNRTTIKMHRIILGLTKRENQVDHIKHINFDNRKSELRVVDNSKNGMNKDKPKNNSSGHLGVSWNKRYEKWEAHIGINNKKIYLGRYSIIEDAIKARKEAEEKYFGEYSYENSMKHNMTS